jgi:hypothetical protein
VECSDLRHGGCCPRGFSDGPARASIRQWRPTEFCLPLELRFVRTHRLEDLSGDYREPGRGLDGLGSQAPNFLPRPTIDVARARRRGEVTARAVTRRLGVTRLPIPVHVGSEPLDHWDDIEARQRQFGEEAAPWLQKQRRPAIASPTLDWPALGFEPRWVGFEPLTVP